MESQFPSHVAIMTAYYLLVYPYLWSSTTYNYHNMLNASL